MNILESIWSYRTLLIIQVCYFPCINTKKDEHFLVLNTTFNNISFISWTLVVNFIGGEGHWQTLSHNVASSTPWLSGIRTYNNHQMEPKQDNIDINSMEYIPPATLTKSFPVALYTSMYLCPMWCLCLFKARSRLTSSSNLINASPFLRPWGLKHKATPPLLRN
jgi:hypothetical protein